MRYNLSGSVGDRKSKTDNGKRSTLSSVSLDETSPCVEGINYHAEQDLLRCFIFVLEAKEESWMKVLPVYRFFGCEKDIMSHANLRDTHAEMLPTALHGNSETV